MDNWPVPQIGGNTLAITTGAIATIPMPQLDTTPPRNPHRIMITCEITKEAFIKPFNNAAGGTPPAAGVLMQVHGAMGPVILNVLGCDSLRTLQKTAGAILYVTPLAG